MNLDSTTLTAIISLLGAIFAGAGLKIVEHLLKKAKDKEDIASSLRTELRVELAALKKELSEAERAIDEWRDRYYDMIEKHTMVKIRLGAALRLLKENGIEPPMTIQSLTEDDD